jgi:serpin B
MEPESSASDVAASNNGFAFDLYSRLIKSDGNQISSPFSIETALAMTALGARGNTAAQMYKTLHLSEQTDSANAAFSQLLKRFSTESAKPGSQISVANALWGEKGYDFRQEFLSKARDYYGAGLMELSFESDPNAARSTINRWVEKETHDRIKDLLPAGSVDKDTRLVLTNAIWFKGTWETQFEKSATKEELFHQTADKSSKAQMMHHTEAFGYFADDQVRLLSMPYKGREMSMVFLLPAKKYELAALEQSITADKLKGWIGSLRQTRVAVTMPKFKMSSEFELTSTLGAMGMSDAFSSHANFSGMTEKEGLTISKVIHKAFIEVNEEGAEAAAATGVMMKRLAAVAGNQPIPQFRADEPFMFLIRDNQTGCILFLGRVTNPA